MRKTLPVQVYERLDELPVEAHIRYALGPPSWPGEIHVPSWFLRLPFSPAIAVEALPNTNASKQTKLTSVMILLFFIPSSLSERLSISLKP
jgi:hypothetical protein